MGKVVKRVKATAPRTTRRLVAPKRTRSLFRGAKRSRLTADWQHFAASADVELWSDLRTLRDRSRSSVRDNPHAAAMARVWVENCVGPDGMQHFPRVMTRDGKLNLRLNAQLTDWWADWGRYGNCTMDRRHSWFDVQRLIARSEFVDGEFLALIHEGRDVNETGYGLQLLDPDQLDHLYTASGTATTGEIRMGVEVDDYGAPQFYHIWPRNPYDLLGRRLPRQRIPAAQVIHSFEIMRPGQTRGIPKLSAALYMMNMLAGLDDAELTVSRMAALAAWVYEQTSDAPALTDDSGEALGIIPLDLEPGEGTLLPKGVTAKMVQPTHPNAIYPTAAKKWLRDACASAGMAYHAVTGDLTDVNFSSIRTGLVQQQDFFRTQHRRLGQLSTVVHDGALRNSVFYGQQSFPKDDWRPYRAVDFEGRGWDWIDPQSDITAASMAIALRVDSRRRIAAQRGLRIEDVLKENERDQALAAQLGVSMPDPLPQGIQATTPAPTSEKPNDHTGN